MTKIEANIQFLLNAISIIKSGVSGKVVSKDKNIQVYQCGKIIRIDIKEV